MAATLMTNHYHAVVIDHDGRITEFTERFHLLLTKATQAYRGWIGKVFDSAKPSYVELLTPAAIIDKCEYTLANPTAAGLVRCSKDWPGVRTRVSEIGEGTVRVERPPMFFAEEGKMPETAEMPMAMAEQVIHVYGVKQTRERIAVARHEAEGHAEAAAKGWAFKGAERVMKSSPYSRAKTLEDRRKLNPRYAGDTESLRVAVAREAAFRERYAAARERWLAGDRHVIWPAGTDAMKRRHRVLCAMPD